ncbi:palmitoyltransferase for Vac8p [Entomophthora muscae]|uniref:Palmitoyltransferase for Vac8p n=1 Tax=Entomophthora muscae TaxID=34485 RepID=A0ACC2SGR9_9FUNG|nr:palmitoyltransferase for Vac8p [Entomophthora muscae]
MAKTTKQKIIKVVGYLPVILCLGAFCWGYYAYVFIYCRQRLLTLGAPNGLRLFLQIAAHLLIILSIWSYLMVVFIHPGTPSKALATLKRRTSRSSSSDDDANLYVRNSSGRDSESPVIESQQLQTMLHSQNENANSSPSFQITVKQNGDKRYCRKCEYEKPDRCHHCSICGECILKMDQ